MTVTLLLPLCPGLGQDSATASMMAASGKTWLKPGLLELSTPPGPETALAALSQAGARPVLLWTGATAFSPVGLEPTELGVLPAATPKPIALDVDWAACEQQLHLPITGIPDWFASDLIWAPDAAALAAIWHDSNARLTDLLPPQIWPNHSLLIALPLALRRLNPGGVLHNSQRLPASWRGGLKPHDAEDSAADTSRTLSSVIWSSSHPYDELTTFARDGLNAASAQETVPYPAIEAAIHVRNPELLNLAWVLMLSRPIDPWRWGYCLSLWTAAGRPWPWTLPMVAPEELPERHRLLLLQCIQAGWLPDSNLDDLLATVPTTQQDLHQLPTTLDAVVNALPSLANADREVLRQATMAAPSSLRFPAFDWANVNAANPSRLEQIQQRIIDSLERGVGFSLVRLGDGEGLFLAGERPCLGGATTNGRQRDAQLSENGHLPSDLQAALIERLLEAVASADIVGVPDLSQCLQGPEDYSRVLPILWRCLSPERQLALPARLLPGGCHLHLFWLAVGAYEQPPFTSVHGVIAPLLPACLAGRVSWQPIPGEKGHHTDVVGPAHYPVIYEETLVWIERQASPGRLFLVGAGILGKIYCDAIRRRGGVAVDVGSVMDLCGGIGRSRGEFRLNPFLVPLAARAFGQADS